MDRPQTYCAKPVTLQAIVWTGGNIASVVSFVGNGKVSPVNIGHGPLRVHTPTGTVTAPPGNYIVKDSKGEVYPCDPEIFEAKYEPESD